ncbi:MAG: hypothetical protein RL385_277 [Pseudomonadota bacterium]|jgi:hypothetical protein
MDEFGFGVRTPTVRVDNPPSIEEAQVDFGSMGGSRRQCVGSSKRPVGVDRPALF